jgi:hypothetical protein
MARQPKKIIEPIKTVDFDLLTEILMGNISPATPPKKQDKDQSPPKRHDLE